MVDKKPKMVPTPEFIAWFKGLVAWFEPRLEKKNEH